MFFAFVQQKLSPSLALSVLLAGRGVDVTGPSVSVAELDQFLSNFDRRRLHSYSQNLVDYHVIMDLVPASKGLVLINGDRLH